WMRFFEELSAPEIGRRLGVAEVTVRTRIHRGLALLRERLEREAGGKRGAWIPSLAAASGIGSREAGIGAGAGLTESAAGPGALIMSMNAKVAVVALCLVVLLFFLWRGTEGPAESVSPEGFEPEVEEVAAVRVPVEVELVEDPAGPRERTVVAMPQPEKPAVEEIAEPDPKPVVLPADDAFSRLRRRFLSTTELEVDSVNLRIDGKKQLSAMKTVKLTPDLRHEVVVLDELLELAFGQPQRLRRTYEHLSASRPRRLPSRPSCRLPALRLRPLRCGYC
ncbi:MAG: hypothetical protein KKI08_12425, partial [Armatimonadetes bacterium]|nr:hypothetical protein [Armatimonadota bacterium]